MGLRNKVKRLLFGTSSSGGSTTSSVTSSPKVSSTPSQPRAPFPPTSTATPKSTPQNAPANTLKGVAKETETVDPKIARHRVRTICARLSLTIDKGGMAPLGDLHDLSEKRFFIAHKAFSDLMEEMVEIGVFNFNWNTQEETITEQGQVYLTENKKKK